MNTRWSIGFFLVVLGGILVMAAGGCEDVVLNTARTPAQPVRPAGRAPATRPTGAAPTPAQPAEAPPPAAVSRYQQVVLHSEPVPGDAPPGLRYVALVHASAGDVGQVLSRLYVPAGPAGSQNRYCLVYPTTEEADAAASFAAGLDIAPPAAGAEAPIPLDAAEAFRYGVGLLYGLPPGDVPDAQRARRIEVALSRAVGDAQLKPILRWAAGMIAGSVTSEYLYDYEAAQRCFAAAEAQAQPGSLEQMSTWFARACAHLQGGHPEAARQLLARIIGQFGAMRDTEIFVRSTRMLTELGRKR